MWVNAALGFIVGTVLGSFVKAASSRLILNSSIWGRSYCDSCKKQLVWYDLFPILSYLLLKGRCRYCHKKIPSSLLLTEVVIGILTAVIFVNFLSPLLTSMDQFSYLTLLDLAFSLFILVILSIVFLVDYETGLILDIVTIPSVVISLIYLIALNIVQSIMFYKMLSESFLGKYLLLPESGYLYTQLEKLWNPVWWAILTGVGLSLFFAAIILLTRGKGMGWGDVKYAVFLGVALGFPKAVVGVFLAFVIGAIYSVFLLLSGRSKIGSAIPFGPFLSLGAYIALVWGDEILRWYLGFAS